MALFPTLPPDTRVWVYASTAPIPRLVQRALLDGLDAFFVRWTSHGRPVAGHAALLDGRFVVLAATLEGLISGCGIDKLDHAVRDLATRLGLSFTSTLDVAYRDAAGAVQIVPRGAFRRLVAEGAVEAGTPVFNTAVTTVGDLAKFEQPLGTSWQAALLTPRPTPAS